jgi:hypothetical protein
MEKCIITMRTIYFKLASGSLLQAKTSRITHDDEVEQTDLVKYGSKKRHGCGSNPTSFCRA